MSGELQEGEQEVSSIRSEYATASCILEAEVDYRSVSGERTITYRPEDAIRATADCMRAIGTTRALELAETLEGLIS